MTAWPTVMVTGHRPQHLDPSCHDWVRTELARLAMKVRDEHATTTGISGMAIGADLWWADSVVNAGMRLWAHVPFPQQPDRWRQQDRDEWTRLLGSAAETTTYGAAFDVKLLHARNAGMIDKSDAAIVVWVPGKTTGGTASAIRKLVTTGKPLVHVNPAARTTTLRQTAGRVA